MWVEKTDRFAEVLAKIRRQHRAHSQLLRREITGKAADVKRRNRSREWISRAFERSVSLCEEPRNQARKRVARASGS